MNVALIGAGRWGKILLKNLVEKFHDKLNVSRYCSTGKKENMDWMSSNYPGISRVSYEEILADPGIKAVFIATPIKTHFDLTLKAIRSGKHVFTEKPLALNADAARIVRQEANRKDLIVFVDYTYVYHGLMSYLKDVLPKNVSCTADFQWHKFGTFRENIIDNLLSHDVALAVYLFGSCASIEEVSLDKCGNILSLTAVFGNYSCKISINRASHFRYKRFRIESGSDRHKWEGDFLNGNDLSNLGISAKTLLEETIMHFLEAVRKNEEPVTGPTFEIRVASCLEEIRNKLSRP